MTQRVLILGAHGLLGRALERHRPTSVEPRRPTREELPLDDLERLERSLREDPVDRVLLLAAWTRVDDCEADPSRAFRVNGILPGRIASLVERHAVPFLFVSTDYVFPGDARRPVHEFDRIDPQNVYGASKWYGECAVREASSRARIVRTSGLYGADGPDFVSAIHQRLESSSAPLRVVSDQITAPTWVDDLAPALWRLALSEHSGTFHLASRGECSWFDFARAIARALGHDEARVQPISTAESGRAARRPAHSVLSSDRAREVLGVELQPVDAAVKQFLERGGAR